MSTARMLSWQKGPRYGESYQKASQISPGWLPLVAALSREEARCLPDLRPTRNTGHDGVSACAPWPWGACREAEDDRAYDEATEISTITLLLISGGSAVRRSASHPSRALWCRPHEGLLHVHHGW